MGVSKGDVSQSAVLSDLDLNAGSFRRRAVLNRAGKKSGNMSLSDHRGVACAPQLTNSGGWNNQPTSPNEGYARYFPFLYNTSPKGSMATFPSGNSVYLKMNGGAPYSNSTSEHITPFKVTESGTYRITGSVVADEPYYPSQSGHTQWQAAVLSSSSGYFSGTQEDSFLIKQNYQNGSDWWKYTFNDQFSLSTSKPYACLVLYTIAFSPSYTDRDFLVSSATFSNMRINKE